MRTIHVTHTYEPGYGWDFTSSDFDGIFVGGTPEDFDYAAARAYSEDAVRFALEDEAELRGEPVATDVEIVHLVPTSASV
jgi:hypothetical protein